MIPRGRARRAARKRAARGASDPMPPRIRGAFLLRRGRPAWHDEGGVWLRRGAPVAPTAARPRGGPRRTGELPMDMRETKVEADTAEFVNFEDLVARFFKREALTPVEADFAALSHQGKVRGNNEDHYLVVRRYRGREVLLTSLPENSLPRADDCSYTVAVADGMGGRDFGELASFLALRTGWVLGDAEVKWTVRVTDREANELRQKASVFFRLIHHALKEMARQNPRMAGMGTTLTLAFSIGTQVFIGHAGDSRAYLYRGGQLIRLTRDHTMAQLLIESGMAEPDSELARKTKRVLVNCLGASELSVDVDFLQQELQDGDRLLLCSDGLTDMVPDAEIARLLRSQPRPESACRALVEAALQAGGRDNITVVLGRYHISSPEEESTGLTSLLPTVLKKRRR
jgi:serine/threonine protein phosphatase PrpC